MDEYIIFIIVLVLFAVFFIICSIALLYWAMEEFKMRMEKAESIAKNDYDKSENKMWFEEYKKKLNY